MAGNNKLEGVSPETIDKAVDAFEQSIQGQQVAEEQGEAEEEERMRETWSRSCTRH